MAQFQLTVYTLGNKQTITLQTGHSTQLKTLINSQYQILDANGHLITLDNIPNIKTVGNDLYVYLEEGLNEPSLILENYHNYSPLNNIEAMSATNTTFATVDASALADLPVLASEITTVTGTTNAITTLNSHLGLLGLTAATAGISIISHQIVQSKDKTSSQINSKESALREDASSEINIEETLPNKKPSEEIIPEETIPSEDAQNENLPTIPTLTINDIAQDNVLNQEEAEQEVVISGTINADKNTTTTVNIIIAGESYPAEINGNHWKALIQGHLLNQGEGTQSFSVQAISTSTENAKTAENSEVHHYRVDTLIEKPIIEIDPITGDNIIELIETQTETITISGRVTNSENSAAKAGDTLTITLGTTANHTQLVANEKGQLTFKLDVGTVALITHAEQGISVNLSTQDEAGNHINTDYTHEYRTNLTKEVSLKIESIAEDNILNATELMREVEIRGSAENANVGDEVELWCECPECAEGWKRLKTAMIEEGGGFSILINGQLLDINTTDNAPTIKAIYKNDPSREAIQDYSIDKTLSQPTTTIVVAGDNKINLLTESDNIIISGKIGNLDSDVTSVNVNVRLGETNQSHLATVSEDFSHWELIVKGSDLAELNNKHITASVDVQDRAGNTNSSASITQDFTVISTKEVPEIVINPVMGDGIVNTAELNKGITFSGRVNNGIAGQTMQVGYIKSTADGRGWNYVWKDVVIQDDLTFSYTFSPEESKIVISKPWNNGGGGWLPLFPAAAKYTADYGDGNPVKATMRTNNTTLIERTDSSGSTGYMRLYENAVNREPLLTLTLETIGEDGLLNKEMRESDKVTLTGYFHSGSNGVRGTNFADRAISANITIGDEVYSGKIIGNALFNSNTNPKIAVEFDVPYSVMENLFNAGTNHLIADAVVSDGYGNTKSIQSNEETFTIDLIPPTVKLTIDTISDDGFININEARQNLTISGTLIYDENDVKAGTVTVNVNFNDVDYNANVDETTKTWSLIFPAKPDNVLSENAGEFSLTATVSASDKAGNEGTHSLKSHFNVDLIAPIVKIQLDPVNDNGVIYLQNSSEDLVISGQLLGEFNQTDKVTLIINNKMLSANLEANGHFSKKVALTDFINNPIPAISAYVETTDKAGNATQAQTTTTYEIINGDIKIELDPLIGVDNLINVTESKQVKTEIHGTISGEQASTYSKVTVSINGQDHIAEVNADLKFNVSVDTSLLLSNHNYLVTASVIGENATSATTAKSYTVSPEVLANIDITHIDHNFVTNNALGSIVRISGEIEFSGIFARGKNASYISNAIIHIGDKQYSVGINADKKTFDINIPTDDLIALNGQSILISFPNATALTHINHPAAGQTGRIFSTLSNQEVTYSNIKLTSDYINDNGNGNYSVNAKTLVSTISGTVSGNAKIGDKIEIFVGEKIYETTVIEGNQFNVEVASKLLSENSSNTITAILTTQDLAGNLIQVKDVEYYVTPNNISDKHVLSLHQDIKVEDRKYDHTSNNPDDYNFAYFMDMFRGASSGFNQYSRIPFGGSETAVIRYHFATPEELDTHKFTPTPESVGTYKYLGEEHKALIHQAYQLIENYINVKFEYSEEYITDGTGTNISWGYHPGEGSAWAVSGAWIMFSTRGAAEYWAPNAWTAYTSLHEILHTLGFSHSSTLFTNENQTSLYDGIGAGAIEDKSEFTYMSYNSNKTGLYLPVYDIAALHYRYGVNPTSRSGNDVYTFERYANAENAGGIYIWDGSGIDTFDASNEKEQVYINLNSGTWSYRGQLEKMLTIKSTTTYTVSEYFSDELGEDTLLWKNSSGNFDTRSIGEYVEGQAFIGYGTQIENAIGSDHHDTLLGNEADNNLSGGKGNDTLYGGKGNDYLDGGEGEDQMFGGLGDDIYVVDNIHDNVTEYENEGTDTVYSLINYTLGEHLENLTLIGTKATQATGNNLNNTLIANNTGNILNGAEGDDRLVGGLGADTLIGGEGNDTFVFNTALNGNIDTIKDFSQNDKIELSKAIFSAIRTIDEVFNHIQYDKTTGELSYKANEGVDAIHFAKLENFYADLQQSHFSLV